jgi:Flp pilus assembly protein TadD
MTLAFLEESLPAHLAAPMDTATAPPRSLRLVEEPPLGDKELGESDTEDAKAALLAQARLLVERHPRSPAIRARLAHTEMNSGNGAEAVDAALSAVRLSEESLDQSALAAAAVVLAALGKQEAGEQALRRASRDVFPYLYALFAVERGEHRTALARLEGQEDPASLALRGWLLTSLRQYSAAIREFRRVVKKALPSPDVLINLGYAYGALGVRSRALKVTEMATYLSPSSRTAAFNLASFRVTSGDLTGALNELRRIEQFYPSDLKIPFAMATARLHCGDPEGAAKVLTRVKSETRAWRASRRDRAELKANLAIIEYRLGRRDRAEVTETVRKALKDSEYQSLGIAKMLTSLYSHRSDASTLEELYQTLLQLHDEAELYEIEARLAILKGEFRRAVDLSMRWVEREPFDSDAAALATYLLSDIAHDYKTATHIGAEALKRIPDAKAVTNNVAYALALAGRPKEARKFLPKVFPNDKSRPFFVATEALIRLASGDIEGGSRGYEQAAAIAAEQGDEDLTNLIRCQAMVLVARFTKAAVSWPAEVVARYADDPRFAILREGLRVEHARGDRPELTPERHELANVLVLPGIPGKNERLDDGRGAYPASTVDIMKLLREQGVTVDYAEPADRRAELTYHAADVWLPVLLWTADALANGAGSLFAHVILQLLGPRRAERSVLHVKCGRQTREGDIRWFEAHGPGADLLKALRKFDKE